MITYSTQTDLPSGYTQVEYIDTDGDSWIDTGINITATTLQVDYKMQILQQQYISLFGAVSNTTPRNGFRIFYQPTTSNNQLTLQSYNFSSRQNIVWNAVLEGTTEVLTQIGQVVSTINGRTLTFSDSDINLTLDATMLIGTARLGTCVSGSSPSRIWYLKITKEGEVVFNGFPARRNSDNVLGMYDIVTGNFLTNAGTGDFIAGPVVTHELKERHIGDKEVQRVYIGDNLVTILKVDEANAEFYKRKTCGTQSVGSGIAAIKEIRGKSIVWNQLVQNGDFNSKQGFAEINVTFTVDNNIGTITKAVASTISGIDVDGVTPNTTHEYYITITCRRIDNIEGENKLYFGFHSGSHTVAGNTMLESSDNEWTKLSGIVSPKQSNGSLFVRLSNTTSPVGLSYEFKNCCCFDLTLMFGAGNEPATVAEFEKMFPLDYYDYNAGTIIPFAGENLVTTGKNQYNPATGKANLLGGQTYQIGGTFTDATIDGVAVTLDSNNCFTATKDCVLDVTGGNATDTIVALYSGENVTFEPYEKHTLPLDPSQWRDKQGNLVFPYGGMHGVGTAYDYAKVDNDGYIRKVVRCFEQVDLGSLSWTKSGNSGENGYYYRSAVNNIKYYLFKTANQTILSSYFTQDRLDSIELGVCSDKSIAANNIGHTDNKRVFAYDSSYTDATTFKTAMNGVMLVYELAKPVEVELATPVYAKYLVDKDGTEEITPANGATPYTTMANLHLVYPKK